MNTNLSDFVEPISPAQPAGANIEYDARFISIQDIAEGKPEQQYGDIIIEAEKPDWNSVEKLCRQLLSESKDLKVFCFYTQALTANRGAQGFYAGCSIMLANLKAYWESIYPTLTDEEEFDPFYRINAISLLLSENGIWKQLQDSEILYIASKKVSLTLKNALTVLNNNDQTIYPGDKEKLIQDLKFAYESDTETLVALKKSLNVIRDIEEIFKTELKDEMLDFSTIKNPLQLIDSYLNDSIATDEQVINQNDNNPSEAIPSITMSSTSSNYDIKHLKITDRNEVNIVLDKLILYFRLKEPSHPAPLFIGRLQKLMDMDFYQIMKDISPSSLNELDMIIGKDQEQEDSENDE